MKNALILSLIFLVGCGAGGKGGFEYQQPGPVLITSLAPAPQDLKSDDADILPYATELNDIIEEGNVPVIGKDVYYQFADLSAIGNGKTIGQCTSYSDVNIIKIDQTWWNNNPSIWDRRSLVWHEMGHCVLGKGHRNLYYVGPNAVYDGGIKPAWPLVNKFLNDGVTLNQDYRGNWPLSIMGSTIVRESKFRVEYEYYLNELLHNNTSTDINNW